jgi:hypothetical protein
VAQREGIPCQEEGEFTVIFKWIRLAKDMFFAEILVKSQFTACVPSCGTRLSLEESCAARKNLYKLDLFHMRIFLLSYEF